MGDKIGVYKAIAGVMDDLRVTGMSKDRDVNFAGTKYKYRGIDDVYNTLSGLLVKNKLVILPRIKSHTMTEHTNDRGKATYHVVLDVDYDLICSDDGSVHTVSSVGEAMDTGDKAYNKAMSISYKYLAFVMFCIPTEGDNDPDATMHNNMEPSKNQPNKKELPKVQTVPVPLTQGGQNDWLAFVDDLIVVVKQAKSSEEIDAIMRHHIPAYKNMQHEAPDLVDTLKEAVGNKREELK